MEPRLLFLVILCFLVQSSRGKELGSRQTNGASSSLFDPTRVTQISWNPRSFLYTGFLTDDECDHLISLSKDKLVRSTIIDDNSGKTVESEFRTSSGMFVTKAKNQIVSGIEARIAAWTFLPQENGESLQILRYEQGQKYEAHFDFDVDDEGDNQELGGPRVATVLMYLSNVHKGGETVFPISDAKDRQPEGDDLSDCARQGYAVKPKKGDALLFFSLRPDATPDPSSLHRGCPVIEGEKWCATKWIHARSLDTALRHGEKRSTTKMTHVRSSYAPLRHYASRGCVDESPYCPAWAAVGECKKNPVYMVGSKESAGYCRRSCKVCSSSSPQ